VRSSQSGNCTLRTHGLPTSLSPNKEERAVSVNMRQRDRRKPRKKVGFVRGMLHVHWKTIRGKTLARQQTKLGHSSPGCATRGSVPLQCYGAVLYWVKQSSRVQSVRSPLVLTANRSVCFRGEPSANRRSV
jgi:hypothetical protein